MSDRLYYDLGSVLGLGVAAAAVCDMLQRWNIGWLQNAYMVYAIVLFVAIALILLAKRSHAYFIALCRKKTRLLGLRLALSIVLFILGWYINAAMGTIHGKDSVQAAYNSARVFAVSATMIWHVCYFAFTRKARKS